ncbi:MAG: Fic family protein [Myxococcota bacterium]
MVQQLQGASLESRVAHYQELRKACPEAVLEEFDRNLKMSWIYHDSAIEGVVYTPQELRSAIAEEEPEESSQTPVYDEIRNHLGAIAMLEEYATKKRFSISLDVIKKLYAILAPEELEGKGQPTYRKDMPLHRLYFHEISPPEKISYRMRQLIQWMNAPETKRSTHAVRLASRAHAQLLHIYPFPRQSGKVARLVLNLVLMRHGYPPVVFHATQRQRYYEALKSNEDAVANFVNQALIASVESSISFLEEAIAESEGEAN